RLGRVVDPATEPGDHEDRSFRRVTAEGSRPGFFHLQAGQPDAEPLVGPRAALRDVVGAGRVVVVAGDRLVAAEREPEREDQRRQDQVRTPPACPRRHRAHLAFTVTVAGARWTSRAASASSSSSEITALVSHNASPNGESAPIVTDDPASASLGTSKTSVPRSVKP